MSDTRPRVVFCTATLSIIDLVRHAAGESDAQAIQRLNAEYGTALTVLPAHEAQERYESRFKTPLREIDAKTFDEALNCLPPREWTRARGGKSFKISERIAGRVTAIYVELGRRFFRFDDNFSTPHEDCLRRAAEFIAANPASPFSKEHSR
jgi:hypothetical protein